MMLKIIGVIFSAILLFSIINGMVIHNNAASMPFGAFLMDVVFLLLIIFYFGRTFFKGFKKGMKFKEVVKANFIWMFPLLFFSATLFGEVVGYLLNKNLW